MSQTLRHTIQVAGDGRPPGSPLKTLPKGTPREDIAASELAQLHDDHFDGQPDSGQGSVEEHRQAVWETPWGAPLAALNEADPGVEIVDGVAVALPAPEVEA